MSNVSSVCADSAQAAGTGPTGPVRRSRNEWPRVLRALPCGLFGAGIILPLNIRFSAAELAYVLNDSGTTVVFTDPMFAGLVERARDEEGAKIDRLVVIGAQPARTWGLGSEASPMTI